MILILKVLAFGSLFAVLNRIRGGGLNRINQNISNVAKPVTGAVIAAMFYSHGYDANVWGISLLCIGLYWAGESLGWGKWIATILDGKPRYLEDEGRSVICGVTVWDGIHHMANALVPERVNFKIYSVVAMAIRGLYWWGPLFILFRVVGSFGWDSVFYLLMLAIWFPASVLTAKSVHFRIDVLMNREATSTEHDWEEAEVVYGFFQGVLLALFFI